jgi:hypothetical protein
MGKLLCHINSALRRHWIDVQKFQVSVFESYYWWSYRSRNSGVIFKKKYFPKNTLENLFFLNYCVSDQAEYWNQLFNFILKYYKEYKMPGLLFRCLDHFKT